MLEAGRRMQGLGLFPKSVTLVAHAEMCAAQSPLFPITDEQFRDGLFPDIERDRAAGPRGREIDRRVHRPS
jgi:hypothetical protein